MERLHFSKIINAPKEKVWHTMLDDKTYREWTEVFSPGSYYKGDWSKGSKILFLGSGEKGEMGMVSRIVENRPYEFISIEHLGIIQDGKEDTTGEAAKEWAPAFENYTFKEVDSGSATEVLIDMDIEEKHKEMFQGLWEKALQKLKTITEQNI